MVGNFITPDSLILLSTYQNTIDRHVVGRVGESLIICESTSLTIVPLHVPILHQTDLVSPLDVRCSRQGHLINQLNIGERQGPLKLQDIHTDE